jgi:hypothetical protein
MEDVSLKMLEMAKLAGATWKEKAVRTPKKSASESVFQECPIEGMASLSLDEVKEELEEEKEEEEKVEERKIESTEEVVVDDDSDEDEEDDELLPLTEKVFISSKARCLEKPKGLKNMKYHSKIHYSISTSIDLTDAMMYSHKPCQKCYKESSEEPLLSPL